MEDTLTDITILKQEYNRLLAEKVKLTDIELELTAIANDKKRVNVLIFALEKTLSSYEEVRGSGDGR